MKIRLVTTAVLLTMLLASQAKAADRDVIAVGGAVAGTCISPALACTLTYALSVADPGDTIVLAGGTYTEGTVDITLDFLTIRGPHFAVLGTGVRVGPALFTGSGHEYIFGIGAHNVTIEGIDIDTSGSTDTWTGIRILSGGWDRWTISNNLISEIDDKLTTDTSNFSFGIYGDAQTTSGSDTMTGGLITGNYIHTLGDSGHLIGANVTSGVGIFLEGLEGDVDLCDPINRFDCGVWIHTNTFEDFKVGQNQTLQGVTTPGGKEYSYGVIVAQDDENPLPNNGALIGREVGSGSGDNDYKGDDVHAPVTDLEIGIRVGIGGSIVNARNANFNTETIAYVLNEDRKATINELQLADFFKTLFPRVFGEGSDMYFADETEAKNASDDAATIVHLLETSAAPDLFKVSVEARGASASYKVSLDNQGDLNVRQGARLLFDGAKSDGVLDGVTEIVLGGTAGEDLLTVDFNNGNPTPIGTGVGITAPGIDFDGLDGFDRIVLRGDEQVLNQSIVMLDVDKGDIIFEPDPGPGLAPSTKTLGTSTVVAFDNLEPIDDLIIVNGMYSVVATDDVNNEINLINGPFRFGFDTFQINSGQNATFEEINFANKKNVHIYGADDTGLPAGDADDVFSIFTEDGDAPDLLLSVDLYGGDAAGGLDASDDYFVVRPSKDFSVAVHGGSDVADDYLFLDCANTDALCDPADIVALLPGPSTYSAMSGVGFKDLDLDTVELTADVLDEDLVIRKELIGFAADGAHPGDEISYRVTIRNDDVTPLDFTAEPAWITDVVDHRLSLVEQSVVVESGTVQVAGNNTAMLWHIDDIAALAAGDSLSMTYTVIVNTLITTEDIHNYASILNGDSDPIDQYVDNGGDTLEHFGHVDLDVLDVFGFPVKAAIQASLFYETEAGPRYMVGLYAGAKDPATGNIGSMLCRVPDTNQAVGWDGGLGNLWYSCGEGLPNTDNLFLPLVVTDLFQDSAGRIWLTSWGFDGLYFSDDGGQTWSSAMADLSGGQGGAPDGIPDGFAQIYAITEDILGTLYISANNGDVYRSFDRAVTWQKSKQLPLGSADTAYSLEADPTVPGKVYAGTFGDSLYVTTDFAETWQRPDGNGLGNGYIFDIELDPISGNLFVGTAKGIFYSSDDGDNWSGLNSAFPFPTNPPEVRNMAFDSNGSFFASTWGQGVWSSLDWQAFSLSEFALKTTNIMDISVSNGFVYVLSEYGATARVAYTPRASSVDIDPETELPSTFTLDQNYPNPFNPTTSIQFNLPLSQQVNLSVYDILGRRVAVLVNDQMSAGQHQVTFQAASLPSGMYLYRLSTPNGAITQKMILLK